MHRDSLEDGGAGWVLSIYDWEVDCEDMSAVNRLRRVIC